MNTNNLDRAFRLLAAAVLASLGMVSTAFAATAVAHSVDPSTLALLAIGMVSLVATRKRVR